MATAKKINQPAYELSLTHEEAATLLDTCMRIGGDCDGQPRKHMEGIMRALSAVGATRGNHRVDPRNRSIWFVENGSDE